MRPDVVWFGEMPRQMERIYEALTACDLFLSIGTSGAVYPAASFVALADQAGAHTVELNLEPSDGASQFAKAIYGPATEIVPDFMSRTAARLARQLRHDLDMRREQELVDRNDAGNAVAAIDQDTEVAGERAGIAGDRHELGNARLGEGLGLRCSACARRVEHHRVIALQLLGPSGEWNRSRAKVLTGFSFGVLRGPLRARRARPRRPRRHRRLRSAPERA